MVLSSAHLVRAVLLIYVSVGSTLLHIARVAITTRGGSYKAVLFALSLAGLE